MDLAPLFEACSGTEEYAFQRVEQVTEFMKGEGLYPDYTRVSSAATEPEVIIEGQNVLMFCSNNYLSLSNAAEVKAAAVEMIQAHGMGPGGSRCLCGNVDVLEDLDKMCAKLVSMPDAITFPTGYMANLSVFRALLDPFMGAFPYKKGSAAVFCDEYNHATIMDGIALSHAKRVLFSHNDLQELEEKLIKFAEYSPKMIVTEGVFSLDGEVAPLKELIELAHKYDAILMVDDAHGVGMMGEHGGGTLDYLGLQGKADIVMGSFDKALGGMGGFIASSKPIVEYMRVSARPYMFSSAVPESTAAGMIKSMELCMSDPERRAKLRENAAYLRSGLEAIGFTILGGGSIPVVPILIGDEEKAIEFSHRTLELGLYAPPFRWPTVPMKTARIRVTPMADHTREHLDRAIAIFGQAGRELGVCSGVPSVL